MTTRRLAPLVLLVVASSASCAGGRGRTEPAATAAESAGARFEVGAARAREAANALGRDLQGKLLAALDSGGPARAIAFCADSAQIVSARHARAGIYVRRVSLRTRNPANRPDAAEERQLRYLDSLHRARALPTELVRSSRSADGARMIEYARPILVSERCLTCHGDLARLAPAVRETLSARYPGDQATGYVVGDLRGMISVRVRE